MRLMLGRKLAAAAVRYKRTVVRRSVSNKALEDWAREAIRAWGGSDTMFTGSVVGVADVLAACRAEAVGIERQRALEEKLRCVRRLIAVIDSEKTDGDGCFCVLCVQVLPRIATALRSVRGRPLW